MSKEQILGIVRHVLTIAAGYLVGSGHLDDATAQQAVGALIGLAGVVWSVVAKRSA
jgi:hypothetical protein